VGEVGGQQGGLTRRVREQPFGVVLLDEIEKADAGVHDLLLQVLGEGRLTDGTGRTVSFRNTVVLLTSNLGADSAGRSLGFGGGGVREMEAHYLGAATAFFRPELLNRLDQVVPYRPLTRDVILTLARRTLEAALAREGLSRRGVKVAFGEDVVEFLARTGFDARYGARPLKRAVEQHVVAHVAQWLAAHASAPPGQVVLRVGADGKVELGA
jgi:ATP-dependent Clp protease ATP-binding subunit ClpC